MIWIGVIAANLAVIRLLYATRNVVILGGGLLLWIVSQVAIRRIVQRRNQPFWIAFLGCGAVALFTVVAAGRYPQSPIGRAWGAYGLLVETAVVSSGSGLLRIWKPVAVELAAITLIALAGTLPILFAACAGGFVCRQIWSLNATKGAN